jgi:beta-mannosidase
MKKQKDLSGTWQVARTEGAHGPQSPEAFALQRPADPGRLLNVPVPMELHSALEGLGLVEDPNLGLNSLKARWVSEQYWRYTTSFDAPGEALETTAWLVFEQLDINADMYLNGERIAGHRNAHLPCRADVTGRLKRGSNDLTVLIESGLHYVAEREGSPYSPGLDSLLNKRHWLRKPQYQFIWDWNPRFINVGITGSVYLEWARTCRIDQVAVWAQPAGDASGAIVTARVFIEAPDEVPGATLRARVAETGEESTVEIHPGRGTGLHQVKVTMERPRLWWPRGHGDPAMYTLEVSVISSGEVIDSASRRFGVRRVEIDRSPHPETGEYFTFRVNGRPVFCKGGNWVPPSLISSSVTRAQLEQLVRLAVQANFNLIRIWGGGTYAGDTLLDLCDESGVMVWHDFLFACAKYPGDDPEFLAEVRREVTWAVRQFAHHPSLLCWCGNNELEWGTFEWGYDTSGKSLPDYAIYHHAIPVILREEDPLRPYWPSSPFSPDHRFPNDPTVGDQHPWEVSLRSDGPDFRAYRRYVDRFPNEGGVLGASLPVTLRQFLPADQQTFRSFAWEHHDNAVNFWTEGPGLTYTMLEFWTGLHYAEMGMDEYAFTSGLLQSEGLMEYITNYRRRMFSSSSAIFWMYNDSWPATHGWSIVDYFLRKKLPYHTVRRAFQPVTVVLADEGERIGVYGVNDSPRDWKGTVRCGLFNVSGGLTKDARQSVLLPSNCSTHLAEFSRADWEKMGTKTHGAFALLEEKTGGVAAQHRMFLERFRDIPWNRPQITISRDGERAFYSSPVFVWGATVDLTGESAFPDNCFDILPGIPYAVPWNDTPPEVLFTGNDIMLTRSSHHETPHQKSDKR